MARPDRSGCVENCDGAGSYTADGIPVVDLDVLANGDADQRSEAIRHLGRACEDWGFFMVSTTEICRILCDRILIVQSIHPV
jgi:isopenicillin N synthase-like dioxygenase